MGKRGPPKKPTAIRLIEGNPSKRPINKREPKPPSGRPTCPRWLTLEAKREWRRAVPILEKMGVLTLADRAALAAYCQAYARWREAEEAIQKYGLIGKTPSGYVQQLPYVTIANKSLQIMRAFASDFGLSPSSRSGLVVEDPDKDANPFEAWKRGQQAK